MIRGAALAMTAALVAAFLYAAHATAQTVACSPRSQLVERLQTKFGEVVIFRGTVGQAMAELWYSPTKFTWTVSVTKTNGAMCLVMAGENAQLISPSEAPPKGNSI